MKPVSCLIAMTFLLSSCSQFGINEDKDNKQHAASDWRVDFFDDFDSFNVDNWQDQILWVNNEDQCYVPDNLFNTREINNGTLKLRVIDLGENRPCDNIDKTGNQHPDTRYVAGRIASKNRCP